MRRERPRDVVVVFIPEYVVGHWWEHLLHNQSALRLKARLLFQPGVMVTHVPWQLASSDRAARRPERAQPGAARRGLDDRAFTVRRGDARAAGARRDPVDRGHAGIGHRPARARRGPRRRSPGGPRGRRPDSAPVTPPGESR